MLATSEGAINPFGGSMEEIFFGVGALILLIALIFGALQYHFRSRRETKVGDEIVRQRYEGNET
jgi:hypothetical protein